MLKTKSIKTNTNKNTKSLNNKEEYKPFWQHNEKHQEYVIANPITLEFFHFWQNKDGREKWQFKAGFTLFLLQNKQRNPYFHKQ